MEEQGDAVVGKEKEVEGEGREGSGEETEEEERGSIGIEAERKLALVVTAPSAMIYPAPLFSHEELCRNRNAFLETFRRFHFAMGTRFMNPVIGGKELDLHLLYVQVTQRGGLEKVILERKWREVIAVFNFPPSATSASFVLRKNYLNLLHHFEQVHYFNVKGPVISPPASLQTKPYLSKPYFYKSLQYCYQEIPEDEVMRAFMRRKRPFSETQTQVEQCLPQAANGNGVAAPGSVPPTHALNATWPATAHAAKDNGNNASGSTPPHQATVEQSQPQVANGNGDAAPGVPPTHALKATRAVKVEQSIAHAAKDNWNNASGSAPPHQATGQSFTLPISDHGIPSSSSVPMPPAIVNGTAIEAPVSVSAPIAQTLANGLPAPDTIPLNPLAGNTLPASGAVPRVTETTSNEPTESETRTGNGFPAPGSVPTAPATGNGPSLDPGSFIQDPVTGLSQCVFSGTIYGKFEHGYLVSVEIGSRKLHGVLYPALPTEQQGSSSSATSNTIVPSPLPVQVHRRRRRLRYRDPAHPKPNRSAYNFFFAEKHAKLRVLHPHRERGLSKLIGEAWSKLTEEEKEVYHAFGRKDKERYRRELKEYRERMNLAPARKAKSKGIVRAESSNAGRAV